MYMKHPLKEESFPSAEVPPNTVSKVPLIRHGAKLVDTGAISRPAVNLVNASVHRSRNSWEAMAKNPWSSYKNNIYSNNKRMMYNNINYLLILQIHLS